MTRILKIGLRGKDVLCLQHSLIEDGYLTVGATGYFGKATSAALKAWQRDHELEVNGIFSSDDREVLALQGSSESEVLPGSAPITNTTPAPVVPVITPNQTMTQIPMYSLTVRISLLGYSLSHRPVQVF